VTGSLKRVITVNTLNVEGKPQFIHSATYEELIEAFGLTPAHIAKLVGSVVSERIG
jgi:hypothetical protein